MSNIICNGSDESQIILTDILINSNLIQHLHDLMWSKYLIDSNYINGPTIGYWEYIETRLNIKLDLNGYPRVVVIQCNSKEDALLFKIKHL